MNNTWKNLDRKDKLLVLFQSILFIGGLSSNVLTSNTYPVQFGQQYTGLFEIPEGDLSLRAQVFRNGKSIGLQLLIHRTELEKRVKK